MQSSRRPTGARIAAVALGLVAAMLAVTACTGSSPSTTTSTPSTTTAPAGAAKPWITGLMDRKGPPATAELTYDGKPLVQAFVIQILWKDVQPNGPGDFDTSKIDSQLAFAKQHDLPVRFRVYAGYNTPQWAQKESGSLLWQGTAKDAGPTNYTVPYFWDSTFQTLFQQFDAKLAAKYDPNPLVREVVPGMCITNFAEPFQRQFGGTTNSAAATAKGYTDAADQACLRKTIDVFKQDWPTTNMAMAFNPYQSATASTAPGKNAQTAAASVQVPQQVATYCVQQLGRRCVLGNNSLKGSTHGKAYDALYAMMHSLGAPIYIQTASNTKIADWQSTLTSAVQIGAISIELPDGYQKWDKATLQKFDAQLEANEARLA